MDKLVPFKQLVHLPGCYLRFGFLRHWDSLIPKLRAQDDGFDQRIKSVPLLGKIVLHGIDQRFIRKLQRPVKRVTEQLAAKVVDELILTMIADKLAQTLKPNPVDAAGIGDRGIDRPACQVFGPHIANGSIPFIRQSKRIKR